MKRWSPEMMSYLLVSLVCLSGCDRIIGCETKEAGRFKSPDSRVDAVITEKDCGATTSVNRSIYLVSAGGEIEGEPIFASYRTEGLSVRWDAPKKLLIEYADAFILNFRNRWVSKFLDNFQYELQVTETKK